MSTSPCPGSYPMNLNKPTIEDYKLFFPDTQWVICQNCHCDKILMKNKSNYYHIVDQYLCKEHCWLYLVDEEDDYLES